MVATVDFFLEDLFRLFVFVPDVNNAFARPRDQPRNNHSLDNEVWYVLQNKPVLNRSRLALIGVANDIFRAFRCVSNDFPFRACRKSSSAQTSKAARLEGSDGSEEISGFKQPPNAAIITRPGVRVGGQDWTRMLPGHRRERPP